MEVEKLPKRHEPIPPSLDTISYLPDALLIEILSYLPTEIAVRTCVLSKRWKSLWTSIPILDFDAKRCPFENPYFVDFVDKVLTLRDGSDLLKFRLLYVHDDDYDDDGNTVPVDGSPVYKWIRSAMGYNVRELDLDLSIEREFELPRCVFTSGSLAALKLRLKCHALKFPTGVGFGCLKSLDLLRIKQMGDTQELDLFSNCPELEYLRISNCKKLGPVLNIFALKLKTLIIEDYWSVIKKIKVSAPNLLSFRYKGMLPNEFDMKDLSSLTHVFLEIRGRRIEIAECNIETAGLRTTKLIQGFFKAESLTLSELCIRFLSKVPSVSKILRTPNYNVKFLKLTAMLGEFEYIRVIECLLKHYINLETLVVDSYGIFRDTSELLSQRGFPLECPLDRLKEVNIRSFEGCECELQFVKFLLMNAKVLERMIIYASGKGWTGLNEQMAINEMLHAFPRASSSISILLS